MKKPKTLIKDIELAIDYLIGYRTQGLHHKQEWYMRKSMMEAFIIDESIPQELKDKLATFENTLYLMRNEDKNELPEEYINKFKTVPIYHNSELEDTIKLPFYE